MRKKILFIFITILTLGLILNIGLPNYQHSQSENYITYKNQEIKLSQTTSVIYKKNTYDCIDLNNPNFGRIQDRDGKLVFKSYKRLLKRKIKAFFQAGNLVKTTKLRKKKKRIKVKCRNALALLSVDEEPSDSDLEDPEPNEDPSDPDDLPTDPTGTIPTYDSLPISNAPVTSRGISIVSTDFTPGSTDYWLRDGITLEDEENLFQAKLQYDDPNNQRDWEIRLGTAGQLYSVRTSVGELIGRQHTHAYSYSRWNDAVIQSVLTDTKLPRVTTESCNLDPDCEHPNLQINKNPDQNQGGSYIRDGLEEPFYSPLLRFSSNASETRSIIWSTISALPTTYQPGILYDQRLKMLNNGVLEVTQLISNFGETEVNRESVPWAVLSANALDTIGYYDSNGVYVPIPEVDWKNFVLDIKDTKGIVTLQNSSSSVGISIIVGDKDYIGDGVWRKSDIRLGELTRTQWPDSKDYVISVRRSLTLKPGESMFFRYFISIGFKQSLEVANRIYTEHANYGFVSYTEQKAEEAGLNYICRRSDHFSTKNCLATDATFALYDYPVVNSKPVFVLKNTDTGGYIYTPDPYAISRISADDPGRFYDGTTEYIELLGWAVPEDQITLPASKYTSPLLPELGSSFLAFDKYLFRSKT